jgi:hypothetical protein
MIGILTNTPPFSSMMIQHIEGGFVCVVPPGSPLVARESCDVATAVHMFLGHTSPSELTDAPSLPDEVTYETWEPATVMRGSIFNVSKVPRAKRGKLLSQGGYMVAYHTALAGTQTQLVAFNRATVMDRLRLWITTAPPEEQVTDPSMLLALAGMRTNPEMDEDGETVFIMDVQHSSQVEDFSGPCPFVARCEDPVMAIGVMDEEVVGYLAEELGEDLRGDFAVRVHDQYLEFGPRVDDDDPGCFE